LNGISDGIVAAIGLSPVPFEPTLSISRDKTNSVTVSWPDNYQLEPYVSQFVLESTTNLLASSVAFTNVFPTNRLGPGNYWLPVPTPVSLTTTSRYVAQPLTNNLKFFRLFNTNNLH